MTFDYNSMIRALVDALGLQKMELDPEEFSQLMRTIWDTVVPGRASTPLYEEVEIGGEDGVVVTPTVTHPGNMDWDAIASQWTSRGKRVPQFTVALIERVGALQSATHLIIDLNGSDKGYTFEAM